MAQTGNWFSSANGSNRQSVLIGKWPPYHNIPQMTQKRQMALHGKWLYSAKGSFRQMALYGKWFLTANGSYRQMALIGKWLLWSQKRSVLTNLLRHLLISAITSLTNHFNIGLWIYNIFFLHTDIYCIAVFIIQYSDVRNPTSK